MTTDPRKTIVFSIEIKNRELIPKCLLAYFFALAGFRVYIGTFRGVQEASGLFRKVVFFHKSGYSRRARHYRTIMASHIAVLDEEMGAAIAPKMLTEIFKARFSSFSKDAYDTVFTLNENHKIELKKLKNMAGIAVVNTGWPRVDLWAERFLPLYEADKQKIVARLGRFALFVSSFGFTSSLGYLRMRRGTSKEANQFELDCAKRALDHYVDLIRWLADQIDFAIVVRPHNGESESDWRRIFKSYRNVHVSSSGDVTAWVLAADTVITYRSTVAMQAALFGKQVVQYKVTKEDGLDEVPVYLVSNCVETREEVLEAIKVRPNPVTSAAIARRSEAILAPHLGTSEGKLAAERIVRYLDNIHQDLSPPIAFTRFERLLIQSWYYIKWTEHICLKPFRRLLAIFFPPYRLDRFEKVPGGLKAAEIEEMTRGLAGALGKGLGHELTVSQTSINMVSIELKQNSR